MIKARRRASEIRQQLSQIPAEWGADIEALLKPRELFPGCVYHSRRRCGKASCQCVRGKLHEAWVVATTVNGKRTTRSLSGESAQRVRALAASYRQFREAQRSLRRRYGEVLGLVRELEELMSVGWWQMRPARTRRKR